MKNAFETLGIPPRLELDVESLNAAFRTAGKSAHPDGGGEEAEFSELREALEILSSPSKRLKHWLELRGTPADLRGTVSSGLMDLFSRVGAATQAAETLVRRRDETQSALGLALLERETHACRGSVEQGIAAVEEAIMSECAAFPAIEAGLIDAESASETARSLAFLEKWRAGLRSLFARLV